MSLQSPDLGKRNAIDDDPSLRDQFSAAAKEEAKMVDKEEAVDEKEKEGDPGVGEKETECENLWRLFDELMKYNENVKVEEGHHGSKRAYVFMKEGMTCEICMSPDHLIYSCPYERGFISCTVPVVSPDYRIICKLCGKTKFEIEDSCQTCIKCGSCIMIAEAKRCSYCLEYGHQSKKDPKCVLYGKELTRENDPLRAAFWS